MQGRTGKSDAQITIEREMDRVRDICMIEASRGTSNGYAHSSRASEPSYRSQRSGLEGHELCVLLDGAKVIASDGTFLGTITNSYQSDSIFNDYGTFGNEFNSKSIWNEFGTYGSEFSGSSAFNEYSSRPPMIIKNGRGMGYLTKNNSLNASLDPDVLRAVCGD